MSKWCLYIALFLILATACREKTQVHTHDRDSVKATQAIELLARPTNQVILSSQKTIRPSQGLLEKTIAASGYITFDGRRDNKVAVRTSGRIEKLYVKYNNQYVKKGQPIAELYSPELSTFLEEYLFLLKSAEDSLVKKTKEKLKLLGLSENQITQVEKSGATVATVTVVSPADGFVRFSSETVASSEMKTSASEMSSMTGAPSKNSSAQTPSAGPIREGMYINKGQTLFVINDCRKVWAILSANAEIKKDDPVTLYSEVQVDPIKAKVDLVELVYQEKQRFSQLRIYVDNPFRVLKINSLMRGKISIQTNVLTVPVSSVYDLGVRKIVWVKKGKNSNGIGQFEPQVVITGIVSNNSIDIISVLQGNEEVASDAAYMLDSESILYEKP